MQGTSPKYKNNETGPAMIKKKCADESAEKFAKLRLTMLLSARRIFCIRLSQQYCNITNNNQLLTINNQKIAVNKYCIFLLPHPLRINDQLPDWQTDQSRGSARSSRYRSCLSVIFFMAGSGGGRAPPKINTDRNSCVSLIHYQ